MQTFKFRKHGSIILALTGLIILWWLVYQPFLANYRRVPSNRVYLGAGEFPIDMLGNLLLVRQGYDGHWLRYANITSIYPSQGFFLKEEYLVIGHIARFFGMEPLTAFHISRFALSLVYLASIYFLIALLFKRTWQRTAGWFLVLFGASFLLPTKAHTDLFNLLVYDAFPMVRLTLAAHHYFISGIAVLWATYFLAKSIDYPHKPSAFFASLLLGITASITYAPSIILMMGGFPFVIGFWWWAHRRETHIRQKIIRLTVMLGIFSGVAFIPLLYVRYLTLSVWDFVTHPLLERLNPFVVNGGQYLMLMGTVYLVALGSLVLVFRERRTIIYFLVPWLITHPVVEFILSDIGGLNRVRVFLTPYFVVFGILAAWVIGAAVPYVKKIRFAGKLPDAVIGAVLTGVVLAGGIVSLQITHTEEYVCFCAVPDFGYPKKSIIQAFGWFAKNTTEQDIVMSNWYNGLMLPAFAPDRVYTSWWFRLSDLPTMIPVWVNMQAFYSGRMGAKGARDFLAREHITYVIVSDDERELMTGGDLTYPFLSVAGRSGNVIIYRVN